MGTRLHTLESGNHDGLVVELDEDLLCAPFALGGGGFPDLRGLDSSTICFEGTPVGVVLKGTQNDMNRWFGPLFAGSPT